MPSCLRLDVGGLSKVLASRRARRSSRGATRGVQSRHRPPLELGNQSRRAAGAPGVSLSRGIRRRVASRRNPSPTGRCIRASPAGSTCTGDARVLRGCRAIPAEKLPICPKIRDSGIRRPGGRSRCACPERRAFPRERAHPLLTAERQPAPKSAPVSQDSKRRGGSSTERCRICTRARTAFPRERASVPRRDNR